MNLKYKIIALMGPSGCGKDTLLKEVLKEAPNLNVIKATTTRPQRENEASSAYDFVDKKTFKEMKQQGAFIEQRRFRDWYYGTSFAALDRNKWNIGIFSPGAIRQMSKNREIELTVCYLLANDKERIIRSLKREDSPDIKEIFRRYNADKKDFKEKKLPFLYIGMQNNTEEDLKYNIQLVLGIIN